MACTAALLPDSVQGGHEESWAIPLLSLQWLMKYTVHLGGESALDMAGYAPLPETRREIARSFLW